MENDNFDLVQHLNDVDETIVALESLDRTLGSYVVLESLYDNIRKQGSVTKEDVRLLRVATESMSIDTPDQISDFMVSLEDDNPTIALESINEQSKANLVNATKKTNQALANVSKLSSDSKKHRAELRTNFSSMGTVNITNPNFTMKANRYFY